MDLLRSIVRRMDRDGRREIFETALDQFHVIAIVLDDQNARRTFRFHARHPRDIWKFLHRPRRENYVYPPP